MQKSAQQNQNRIHPLQTSILTSSAMIAFAANSIICREVLKTSALDAASFTTIRIASGALTLWLLTCLVNSEKKSINKKSWHKAIMLFVYAVAFSFAYLDLSVATGALILFGSVQATMMLSGFLSGERLNLLEWAGFLIAACGFFILVFPGLSTPSIKGAILMSIAGIAWGVYSLLGRKSKYPAEDSSINFMLAAPMCIAVSLFMISKMHITPRGMLLAAVSGSLTSGCAYVIWYKALNGLTAIRASIVQLSVPVLAAVGGVLLLSETISAGLLISGGLILGGIAIGLGGLSRRSGSG